MKSVLFFGVNDLNLYQFRLPIMKALVERGFRVLALTSRGDYADRIEKEGIEFVDFPLNRSSLNPFAEIVTIYKLIKVFKRLKPDIVHCFAAKPNIYGAIAAKFAGTKITYITITGLGSFFISSSFKAKIIKAVILVGYKIAVKISTKILFQNGDDYRLFIEKKIASMENAEIIGSSGLDTNFWRRETDRISQDGAEENINILFVGRLIVHKGIIELLEAAKIIKEKYGDRATFTIVGGADFGNKFAIDGEELKKYNSIANFAGEQKDIKPFYEKADIFILPSYREGVSRALLEAASMETAIITTDAPGCRDTIENGVSGIIVPIKNIEKLIEAIDRLICDKNLRTSMQKNARKRAIEIFDIRSVIERYLLLY